MLRLLLTLAALAVSGCFIDAEGLPPPVGGDPAGGGSPPGTGGSGGEASSSGGAGGVANVGGMGGTSEGGAPSAQHCPPGEVATDISEGVLECAPIGAAITKAIADSCAVFYGWRDNCNAGCTMLPDRIGKVTSTSCVEITTGDSTCQTPDLGADMDVQLFGWDLDGSADDGDRFYGAIHCAPGVADEAPCDGDSFVTKYDGESAVCNSISGAVLDYVRPSCALVRGWRDMCGNCTNDPTKYVSSTSVSCDVGQGGYCAQATYGADTIELASFDTDGGVGEDDKLHFGLRCAAVTSQESTARDTCPAGEFVVGLEADGTLVCSDLEEASMTAFRQRCALFAGWRDNCDACTDAPAKWGRVRDGDCSNNGATDDTCSTRMLGGQTVSLYGVNLDGGVNSNDKFYLGLRCE